MTIPKIVIGGQWGDDVLIIDVAHGHNEIALKAVKNLRKKFKVPIIADGGTNYPGDLTKALACGASSCMLAGWFAGTDEALLPYKGKVSDVIYQLLGAIRSGMSYCDAKNLKELWQKAEFVRITEAGWRESKAHNVQQL